MIKINDNLYRHKGIDVQRQASWRLKWWYAKVITGNGEIKRIESATLKEMAKAINSQVCDLPG